MLLPAVHRNQALRFRGRKGSGLNKMHFLEETGEKNFEKNTDETIEEGVSFSHLEERGEKLKFRGSCPVRKKRHCPSALKGGKRGTWGVISRT